MTHDLFGEPVAPVDDKGSIKLALRLFRESAKGWLLGDSDREVDAQWAPKSEVRRGEGRDENVWTMPVWVARDRRWI